MLFIRACIFQVSGSSLCHSLPVRNGVFGIFCHFRVSQATAFVGLKDWVPPEVQRAPRWDDNAVCPSVKEAHLAARPRTHRKESLGIRRLVVVGRQQVVQPFVAL